MKPQDPTRWRDLPEASDAASLVVRAARRPRAPGTDDLARLGGAVADLPRRSLARSLRNARLFAAAATAVTLLALGGGVYAWRGRLEPTRPAPAPTFVAAPVARPTVAAAPTPVAEAPPARRAVAHATPRPAHRPAPPAAPEPDALTREIALVDAARRDLATAPAQALRAADAHRRAFPDGQLGAEREFLAVEALRRLGRIDEARARATALAARYPSTSYATRAARLLPPTP